MFLLVGSNSDDVLYFSSLMRNKRTEKVLSRFEVEIGTILNSEIVLLKDVYTSFLTTALTQAIIDKYFILLVLVVGKCAAYSNDLKIGDIVVCRSTVLGGVDQIGVANVSLGQIPSLPPSFPTSQEVTDTLLSQLGRIYFGRFFEGTFVSTNSVNPPTMNLEAIAENGTILGHSGTLAFDCEIGGIAFASYLGNVPYIAIKVVERRLGEETSVEEYRQVLSTYSSVGKALVATIGEIGRSDVLHFIG